MKIKKAKFDGIDTFNDYDVSLSYGQLVAIRNALEKDHAEPLADEMYAELVYWLDNVAPPGVDSAEFKEQRDASKKTQDEAGEEISADEAPPGDTELEAGKLPPPPSGEEEEPFEGGEGAPEGGEGEEGGEFEEGPKLSPEEREIIDRAMPTGRPTGPGAERGPLGRAKGILLPAPPLD
jgi:hypothetical protein